MPSLEIDGRRVEMPVGSTILDACRKLGIDIPTMCHRAGYDHFTSCMICVVRDQARGRLLPACSASVQDGMVIDASGAEVRQSRRAALELLLSDHVGDCEAPCQRVSPLETNIPAVIREIAAGRIEEAAAILAKHGVTPEFANDDGDMKSQKVCRRGQIDGSVSICELERFVVKSAQNIFPADGATTDFPDSARFNSVLGRLTDEEKERFLAVASAAKAVVPAADSGYTKEEAMAEAARCLHCDCRKPDSCKLRQYATEYGAKQSRFKTSDRRLFEQVAQHVDVIFEQGKCISCGLCVRITKARGEELGLSFTGRGISTRISVPFGESMTKALVKTAHEVVEACPTGALAFKDGDTP